MNRIAAAFVVSTCAGGALAQSTNTLYGVVEIGVASISDMHPQYGARHVTKMQSGMLQGSRLGLRGSETLDADLSALFTIEAGFLVDTGASAPGGLLFGRQAFVGFRSARLGTLTLGRQYGPEYLAWAALDPMADGFAGAASNLLATNGKRVDNAVVYTTPSIKGLTVDLMYGFGEVAGNARAGRNVGASLAYESGPLYVTAAYNRLSNANATDQASNYIAGASADFKFLKLSAAYAYNKGMGDLRSTDLLLGATMPFGAHTVMASAIGKNDRTTADKDAYQVALTYTYHLSKRTVVYTSGAKIFNRNGAAYRTYDADAPTPAQGPAGGGTREFNVGIRHAF